MQRGWRHRFLALIGLSLIRVASAAQTPDSSMGTGLQALPVSTATGSQGPESAIPLPGSIGFAAVDDPLAVPRVEWALDKIGGQRGSITRGAKDAAVYASVSPSVVLIVAKDKFGTGTVVSSNGDILTNWHVVGTHRQVAVIFKPKVEGSDVSIADAVRGTVLRVDQVADLALVRVVELPITAKPIALGSLDSLVVGADVHAIGHPTGESWTYTRGIVSQIRRDFHWSTEDGASYEADVVQTQTPISPGNSGGPLLDDSGRLVGVNAFKGTGEGLNFAIAVSDVDRFIRLGHDRLASAPSAGGVAPGNKHECETKTLGKRRNADPPGQLYLLDVNCSGRVNAEIIEPDDPSKPLEMLLDTKGTGKINVIMVFKGRSDNIDYALYDTKGSGKVDLIGYFRDGEIEPYKVEPFRPRQSQR